MPICPESPSIDLTVVACRRPELLDTTLSSFSENLFKQIEFNNSFFNIDPIMGCQSSHNECLSIIGAYFPNAIIYQPEKANFTAAVRRVWSSTKSDLVLHLEDDWILSGRLDFKSIESKLNNKIKAVCLLSQEHGDKGKGDYSEIYKSKKLFGFKLYSRIESIFNTSPSLYEGDFIRKYCNILNINLDPEKQTRRKGGNHHAYKYMQNYRFMFEKINNMPSIIDIGRNWRENNNFTKIDISGKSIWEQTL